MPTTPTANTTLEINVLPREDGRPDGSTNHGRTGDELAVLRSTSSARVSGSPQTCFSPARHCATGSPADSCTQCTCCQNATPLSLCSLPGPSALSIDSTEVIDRARWGDRFSSGGDGRCRDKSDHAEFYPCAW